jgi:hypothetical protein
MTSPMCVLHIDDAPCATAGSINSPGAFAAVPSYIGARPRLASPRSVTRNKKPVMVAYPDEGTKPFVEGNEIILKQRDL